MDVNRKPIPTGPPPPYFEGDYHEPRPGHEEQEQQQPAREDGNENENGRQRRWDTHADVWRQPLSQLENWSQSQLENWNQRQPLSQLENWSQAQWENFNQRQEAWHQAQWENWNQRQEAWHQRQEARNYERNNQPVPIAFTELPENQPFHQRPVTTQNSPNGVSGTFPQQQQPVGEPSYRYLEFPRSPAQNKFSPTTDHHQPSPITELYYLRSTPEARSPELQPPSRDHQTSPTNEQHRVASPNEALSPSLQPPSRDHEATQQPPAQHQSCTPPLTESRTKEPDSSVSSQFKIQRKPLRSYKSSPAVNDLAQQGGALSEDTQRAWDAQAAKLIRNNTFNVPPLPPRPTSSSQGKQPFQSENNQYSASGLDRPDPSLKTSIPSRMMAPNPYLSASTAGVSNLSLSSPNTRPSTASSSVNFGESTSSLSTTITSTDTNITETGSITKAKFNPAAKVQDALREVRHFAGGLIHHPATSTKEYSILRHSHGLVFYQGPNTSLTISLFASKPMPETRKIYLQSKGWSGNTGMRAKQFFGATKNWIDVTPNLCISAEQLNPRDERAWQRDIKSFGKRRDKIKKIQKHVLRETSVIRIPSDAGDGYFQLILCFDGVKQKVLCTSPTFRLLSLSSSPSSIKGASLSTLPLELSIVAAEFYLQRTAGTVLAPAAAVVQSKMLSRVTKVNEKFGVLNKANKAQEKVGKVTKHVPEGFLAKAAEMFEGASGADDGKPKDGAYLLLGGSDISLTHGPATPYPIHFTGESSTSFQLSDSSSEDETPRINLGNVSSSITTKLWGHYFGWTRYQPKKELLGTVDDEWHHTIISILPPTAAQLKKADFSTASKKLVTIRIIDEVDTSLPVGVQVEVYVMGFLAVDEALLKSETNTPLASSSSSKEVEAGVGVGVGVGTEGHADDSISRPKSKSKSGFPFPSISSSTSTSTSTSSPSSTNPPTQPPSETTPTPSNPDPEEELLSDDLTIVKAVLSEQAWSFEAAEEYRKADRVDGVRDGIKRMASMQGVVGAKAMVVDSMGKVPLHKLGVRMGDGGEGGVVVNGFWVRRDVGL